MFGSDLQQSLMKVIPFTAEDLAANRSGTITETQRARLGKQAGCTRFATLLMFIFVILLLAGIGAYLFVFSDNGKSLLKMFSQDSSTLPIVAGTLAAVAVVIFASFLRTLLRTNDVARGKVSVTEGPMKVKSVNSVAYTVKSYVIKVGKVQFYVNEAVFGSLIEDQPYRIFYIKNPPINTILSLEQI